MAIDPATGIDIPSPSDDFRRRRPDEPIRDRIDHPTNEALEMARDIEERSLAFWLPIAVAAVLLVGLCAPFQSQTTRPNVRADAGAITKSKP